MRDTPSQPPRRYAPGEEPGSGAPPPRSAAGEVGRGSPGPGPPPGGAAGGGGGGGPPPQETPGGEPRRTLGAAPPAPPPQVLVAPHGAHLLPRKTFPRRHHDLRRRRPVRPHRQR